MNNRIITIEIESMKIYLGEFLGTFILVFIGCGSIAGAEFIGLLGSLPEVALVWGLGVAFAIFTTRKICPAHLNPAVSLALCLTKDIEWKKLPFFIFAQFIGAVLAGIALYVLLQTVIETYEHLNGIQRGVAGSEKSAMMFGEFYPNPSFSSLNVSTLSAFALEAIGTFCLVTVVFLMSRIKKKFSFLPPLLIGLTVTLIIIVIAPYTQAGLNPARDFGPRLVAYFSGWGDAAFPKAEWGFLIVYILGPMAGAVMAFLLRSAFRKKAL